MYCTTLDCHTRDSERRDRLQYYLELVACLCVFLSGQVIIALTHAAVSYALQQPLSGLLRQVY